MARGWPSIWLTMSLLRFASEAAFVTMMPGRGGNEQRRNRGGEAFADGQHCVMS